MGSGAGSFFKVVLKNFDVLAGPLVGLLYPLYASIRAIETKSQVEDQQWLTYWVFHSMITLFEMTFAKVLEWIPIWPYAKLVLLCWLSMPCFSGASYVYEHYLRPLMVNQQRVNLWYVPKGKDPSNQRDDIITAAEKYIQQHGSGELQYMLDNAEMRRRNSSSSYYGYAEDHEY
ncbi:HVA22-like protein a [Cucurbita pepo subsp. pepo]|uniref:HVA22-like protein a n=1 Tax=Cucurbita pepo subsp. pepo TaxID=3664 RepID=UPI000C9D64EB|nr:HVA22-like protein a [Cucurbita pepo subsp. pepo]